MTTFYMFCEWPSVKCTLTFCKNCILKINNFKFLREYKNRIYNTNGSLSSWRSALRLVNGYELFNNFRDCESVERVKEQLHCTKNYKTT